MARKPRIAPGGYVYHVLNRGIAKTPIFETHGDWVTFEEVLLEAVARFVMRVLAYAQMPNHWHLLLWPKTDDELSIFMQWLESTHVRRWHVGHGTVGCGALYQSRFKAIPVQTDEHLRWVWRYVERNPVRANLVARAEEWRWSSVWQRRNRNIEALAESPIVLPDDWLTDVNRPQTPRELDAFRRRVIRNIPFGDHRWARETAKQMGMNVCEVVASPFEPGIGLWKSASDPKYAESAYGAAYWGG